MVEIFWVYDYQYQSNYEAYVIEMEIQSLVSDANTPKQNNSFHHTIYLFIYFSLQEDIRG